MPFHHSWKQIYRQSNIPAAILDFGRQEQNRQRYSLANSKKWIRHKKYIRKAYLPTLTPKCLGLSKYLKTGLVYISTMLLTVVSDCLNRLSHYVQALACQKIIHRHHRRNQGSDTRVHTQKTWWFFWVHPPKK